MTTRNKNGHAVTSVLPSNSDSVQVAPAQPQFIDTQGPAANGAGGTGGNDGFAPAKKKVKRTFPTTT